MSVLELLPRETDVQDMGAEVRTLTEDMTFEREMSPTACGSTCIDGPFTIVCQGSTY